MPCCFTMERKTTPSPSPAGAQARRGASRGLRRGEAERLPGVWRWGEEAAVGMFTLCLSLCGAR